MDVCVIAVPYDSALRGYRMGAGPDVLLAAGFIDGLEAAGHRVDLTSVTASDPPTEIRTAFELSRSVADAVRAARSAGQFPIVLTGNCISTLGVVAALGDVAPGVIWFDAHGDLNTPDTSASGFLDGMALAVILGTCWTSLSASVPGFQPVGAHRALLLGARDLDDPEREFIAESELRVFDSRELASPELQEAVATLGTRACIHLDLDVLDGDHVAVNALSSPGGPTESELVGVLEMIAARQEIAALTISAYDPGVDPDGLVPPVVSRITRALLAAFKP